MENLNIQEEIDSLYNIGFDSVFFLYEKAPWYKSLGVLLFGILKIGVGVLFSNTPVLKYFSLPLFKSGIDNIGKGIEMFMNGKDFENLDDFFDFQISTYFGHLWNEPLIIERDKKIKYDVYRIYIENNSSLRDKIIINREKMFKSNFIEKLKEIDLNLEKENEKIEKIEKNMANIKEKVAENIMKKLKNTKCYKNIFLYFNGDMTNIRKYIQDKLGSLMNLNISKEENFEDYSDESELVEKIAQKLEGKIIESLEKDENIKKNSRFLNDFKNESLEKNKKEINKLITENNEQNKKSFESEKENLEKNVKEIKENFMKKQEELNNGINQKLQQKIKDTQDNIINEFNQKIKFFNEKQNELSPEESENLKKEIEETQKNIKDIVENACNKTKDEIEQEHKKNIENEKKNTEELINNAQDNYNKEIEKIQKKQEEFKKEIEEKQNENIKKLENLSNDDFAFKENKIFFVNEGTKNEFEEEYLCKYNQDFENKIKEYDNYFNDKIKFMVNEQISNIEAKLFNETEKNRKSQVNNFKNSMIKDGNPVFKCFSKKYEYYSSDMEILGKQIMKNFPNFGFDYFVDNNIKSLREKVQAKKALIGNYNDSKTWNTVAIIPKGDEYIILYKNQKGLNYDDKFIEFLNSIGIDNYSIKVNSTDQSKENEKSSCIFSLKNLQTFSEYIIKDKQNFIEKFEQAEFKEISKEELANVRKEEFLNLYLKDIYEKIKQIRNDNNDSDPIDLLEIIDFCVDRKNSDKSYDFLDIIYEQLKTFITDEEKERFKESIKKYKKNKIEFENDDD